MDVEHYITSYGDKKFDYLKIFFDTLSKYIFAFNKLLVAVSGGSDSMLLSVLIYNFFIKNNFDLQNLHIVHCNHNTREETMNEQKFVESFFEGLNLHICVYDQNKKSENDLRVWRYSEFQKIINDYNIDFIATGHNLTDRVESSFMNMFRGSGLNGFLSMSIVDQSPLIQNTKIIRPLLFLTKNQIEELCQKINIPFVVDQTNLLPETSLRNRIRLKLFPEFQKFSSHPNMFFDSIQKVFSEIENMEQDGNIGRLQAIKKSEYWNCDFAFLRNIPVILITKNLFLQLLNKLNIAHNITDKTLSDFVKFFTNSKHGYKYKNGVYFFLSHSKIYIIKAKLNFWQKTIEKSLFIDRLGDVKIGKEMIKIDKEELIGLELRYPKQGDMFGSKSWSKYCINHQIPVFWRNFIPVIIRDNKIIKHFYI